jgi:ActR/RegA family two-component response regulator
MARVLLVDDDVDALELRKRIFERDGYQVATASSVSGAREQFGAEPPDTVVIDLRVPNAEDGLGLIRDFRAAAPHMKIVVLAGWCADIEGRNESAMVDVVLSKPARSEVLLRAVKKSS